MTNEKWSYVAKGHYSTPGTGGTTIHVLRDGTVYKTHPTRKTVDITGAKADTYIESAGGKMRTTPKPPAKKPSAKPKTKSKKPTKRQVKKVAKKLVVGAGKVIGTVRAFTTMIGEEEEAAYKRRMPTPSTKRAKPKKRREQTLEEYMGL